MITFREYANNLFEGLRKMVANYKAEYEGFKDDLDRAHFDFLK